MTGLACDAGTPVLIISPHFDDAVLSAWALIEADPVTPVDVLTVFGGAPEPAIATAGDIACGFADSAEAMCERRREDAAALQSITRTAWYLPLLELQYGGLADRAVAREHLLREVASWIEAQVRADGSRPLVVAPGGAGAHVSAGLSAPSRTGSRGRGGRGLAWLRYLKHRLYVRQKHAAQRAGAVAHPDHLFVRDVIVETCMERQDVDLWLYEDLPYLWSGPADAEVAVVAAQHCLRVTTMSVPINQERKAAALANYASQLTALDPDGRRLESAETLPATERYWRLTKPSA